jgi:hypothetical protein
VAASSASRNGRQSGNTWTAMPILIRRVCAAIALAMLSGAGSNDSARLEIELGQSYHIEPPTFRDVDLLHCFVEGLALGSAGSELVKPAEFHELASHNCALNSPEP